MLPPNRFFSGPWPVCFSFHSEVGTLVSPPPRFPFSSPRQFFFCDRILTRFCLFPSSGRFLLCPSYSSMSIITQKIPRRRSSTPRWDEMVFELHSVPPPPPFHGEVFLICRLLVGAPFSLLNSVKELRLPPPLFPRFNLIDFSPGATVLNPSRCALTHTRSRRQRCLVTGIFMQYRTPLGTLLSSGSPTSPLFPPLES